MNSEIISNIGIVYVAIGAIFYLMQVVPNIVAYWPEHRDGWQFFTSHHFSLIILSVAWGPVLLLALIKSSVNNRESHTE